MDILRLILEKSKLIIANDFSLQLNSKIKRLNNSEKDGSSTTMVTQENKWFCEENTAATRPIPQH